MPIERLPSYGGQALIEGVLMRGSHFLAAAFRKPDGEIVIQTEPLGGVYLSQISKIPFLRGLILLWDSLGLGTRYLTISANIQGGEEEKIEGPSLYLSLAGAFLLGILIFFVAPAALGQAMEKYLYLNSWISNLFEGVVRFLILIGYLWLVGKMPEISRVFRYHGAEHKTINAFEAGSELRPEVVARYSIEHPRCGTSFLLTVVLLSVILFSILGPLPIFWKLISRIIFIPLLAAVAYEYIRWTSRHLDNKLVRLMIRPNLAMQKFTTREPSLEMIDVAIHAFQSMVNLEDEYQKKNSVI
jgi:uncharacterized protein YqhQ